MKDLMKLVKKGTVCLLSVGMSAALLAGCGSKDNGGASGNGGADVNVDDLSFPLAETVTIRGLTNFPVGTESEPNNRTIFKRLEEKTNVHIDWKTIQGVQCQDTSGLHFQCRFQ